MVLPFGSLPGSIAIGHVACKRTVCHDAIHVRQEHPMRRTHWAVFTSMNPRPSAWRAVQEPTPIPAENPGEDRSGQPVARDDAAPSDPSNQRLEV